MNLFLRQLYREGFWIKREKGLSLAKLFSIFMRCYQFNVAECRARSMNRFTLIPKCHMLHHTGVRLRQECAKGEYCCNPLSESVQMQEDFIGRPARISRRVSVKLVHLRSIQRSLIAQAFALKASDADDRF